MSSRPVTHEPEASREEQSQTSTAPVEISSRQSSSSLDELAPSPPPPDAMASETMGPPKQPASAARKRSHEQVEAEAHSVDSSRTAVAQLTPRGKLDDTMTDTSDVANPEYQTQTDSNVEQQPTPPTSSKISSSHRAPPSGQGSQNDSRSRPQSRTSFRSASSKAEQANANNGTDDATTEESDSESIPDQADPGVPIGDFDWRELETKWHSAMKDLDAQEQEVINKFNLLTQYFSTWADAGSTKETDRGFKRLRTQHAYVQHKEADLEEQRDHYNKVVDAFTTVEKLLNDDPDRIKARRLSRQAISRLHPVIASDYADSIDLVQQYQHDFHASRCVIL